MVYIYRFSSPSITSLLTLVFRPNMPCAFLSGIGGGNGLRLRLSAFIYIGNGVRILDCSLSLLMV